MDNRHVALVVLLLVSWMFLYMVWLDNRALAKLADIHNRGEWVRPETLVRFSRACGDLSEINRENQRVLAKARDMLEEIDEQRRR